MANMTPIDYIKALTEGIIMVAYNLKTVEPISEIIPLEAGDGFTAKFSRLPNHPGVVIRFGTGLPNEPARLNMDLLEPFKAPTAGLLSAAGLLSSAEVEERAKEVEERANAGREEGDRMFSGIHESQR